ncbi:MAG: response regulator transcription factor [Rhodospirillales bacterium]|nr:response regulator transcription factor [Rhodospirillales bacterium]
MHILIADDHALFRGGLSLQLKQFAPNADIVEARDFGQTLDLVKVAKPPFDLVLVDLGMPGMAWRDALLALRGLRVRTVVLSGTSAPATVREALSLGASGYIPKSDEPDVLMAALKLVMSGGTYVPLCALGVSGEEQARQPVGAITTRQREVLGLLAHGFSNKEIAYRLSLTEGTVKLHVAAILRSLGVTNRTQAVTLARASGLIVSE